MRGRITIDSATGVRSYTVSGKAVTEAEFHEAIPSKPGMPGGGTFPSNYPMYSDAVGCNPDHRFDMMAKFDKMGIPTQVDEQGRCVFESASHRREHCQRRGFLDRDGGYSDPQPGAYREGGYDEQG